MINNFRIFGSFSASKRQYIVRDPEAYKRIAIKDYDHFEDIINGFKGDLIEEINFEVIDNCLSALRDGKWRQMRSTLIPAFIGSKIRQMFELVLRMC